MKKSIAKILALVMALMLSVSCAIVASAAPQKVDSSINTYVTEVRNNSESVLPVDAVPENPLVDNRPEAYTHKFQNFIFIDGFTK